LAGGINTLQSIKFYDAILLGAFEILGETDEITYA
jgi:hypothetical protein